jgi:hypothetical protein
MKTRSPKVRNQSERKKEGRKEGRRKIERKSNKSEVTLIAHRPSSAVRACKVAREKGKVKLMIRCNK